MTLRSTLIVLATLWALPHNVFAAVLISEVAWMGTDADANNEWIELYNFSNAPTNLAGYTLVASSNDNPNIFTITLAGTLTPHGVGVLERTDDTTLPDVTAFMTYTGALPNSGEGLTITVKDGIGAVSDQASGGASWAGIGGSNTPPKKTAQRTMTGLWVTAAPTPGAQNAQVSDEASTTTDATEDTNESTVTATKKKSGGGGGRSRRMQEEGVEPGPLTLSVYGPTTVYVNQTVSFEANPHGQGKTVRNSLSYEWNFGDTYTSEGRKVSHVFRYPGDHVVVAEGVFGKHRAIGRHEVKVLPVSFSIKRLPSGDIAITNGSDHEVDMGGFTLKGPKSFTVPRLTFVKGKGTLVVPKDRIGSHVALVDMQGTVVTAETPTRTDLSQRAAIPALPASPALVRAPVPAKAKVATAQATTVAPIALASTTTETVIRIGDDQETKGFMTRMFGQLTRFFRD